MPARITSIHFLRSNNAIEITRVDGNGMVSAEFISGLSGDEINAIEGAWRDILIELQERWELGYVRLHGLGIS